MQVFKGINVVSVTVRDLAKEYGVHLRPHAKTHKTPAIAQLQVKAGAIGVCCQKVSEAEAMVEGGIGDVYVSNEVVGRRKVERLAALARRARISTCVDHPDQVDALSEAARKFGVTIGVRVEIRVGNRCGVPPGAAARRRPRRDRRRHFSHPDSIDRPCGPTRR